MNSHSNERSYQELTWSVAKYSPGTAGCFLKAEEFQPKHLYYKLSNYNLVDGFFGHESINEVIASKLAGLLGFNHVEYKLLTGDIIVNSKEYHTDFTVTEDFVMPGEKKISIEDFKFLNSSDDESYVEMCSRIGILPEIERMMVFDFIIGQRDRHGANLELLQSLGGIRVAPLFDNGLSLLFSCYQKDPRYLERVEQFDITADFPVNSFLGTYSLFRNLEMLQNFPQIPDITRGQLDKAFSVAAGKLAEKHLAKIKDMILWRCAYYEEFRNNKLGH